MGKFSAILNHSEPNLHHSNFRVLPQGAQNRVKRFYSYQKTEVDYPLPLSKKKVSDMVITMDTIFVESKKNLKFALIFLNMAIVLILCVCSSKSLLAQETFLIANTVKPIINTAVMDNTLNKILNQEQEKKIFNESVAKRYKSAVIKDVELGVKHIKLTRYVNKKPVRINVVEINRNLNPSLKIAPTLASDTLNHRVGISKIAGKKNSIVAINGTFFKPQTGVPLGTLMIDGELQTGPIYDRVAFGIFENRFDTARVQLNASLKTGKETIKIDNINQPRMLSIHNLLYTSKWGEKSAPTPKYGIQASILDNRIIEISKNSLSIPKGGYVISGPESRLGKLKAGDKVVVDIKTIPQWDDVVHIISGGPYLIKRNMVFIDVYEEKLPAITGRNPRTAIGYTAENNLVLVTVDGRENQSVGMSLRELALFMKSIGCYEAINLDGGGSSVMYIKGQIINSPAQKGGIALSNALTVGF